jgi:hypothetical protein
MKLHKLNLKAATEGVWLTYGPQPEIEVKIAMYDNPRGKRWMRQRGQEIVSDLRAKGMPDAEVQDRLTCENLAENAILDWRNLDDDDGTPAVCEPETALRFLLDPARVEFKEWCLVRSTERRLFLEQEIASAEGNSSRASRGTLPLAPTSEQGPTPSPSTGTSPPRVSAPRSRIDRICDRIFGRSGTPSGTPVEADRAA